MERGPRHSQGQLERLYRHHREDVERALARDLSREDAEDVTQTTFLNAYGALLRGSDPHRPRAWLLAIAENLRRRRYRTERRTDVLSEEFASPESDVTTEELRGALAQLPFQQRSVLLLRELGGLSYAEIADRQQTSVGAVQMLLFRARKALREELEGARARWIALPFPSWVQQLLQPDRFVFAGRAAGAIAAVVATVTVAAAADEPRFRAAEIDAATSGPRAWVGSPLATAAPRVRVAAEPSSGLAPTGSPVEPLTQDDAPREAREPATADRPGATGAAARAQPESGSGSTAQSLVETAKSAPLIPFQMPTAPELPPAPTLPSLPSPPAPPEAVPALPDPAKALEGALTTAR